MNEDWRGWFGWSVSKSHSWNQCKRRFYYSVIKKFDKDPEGLRAKQLSSLTTLDMLKGSAVHSAIAEQIFQVRAGRPIRLDSAIRHATRKISENTGKNIANLVEHRNGIDPDEDDIIDVMDSAKACLTNFCQDIWPQRAECKCLEQEQKGVIKKFQVSKVTVFVNPDYISESNSVVTVTDWKTGERERDADNLQQMSVYAMYAMEKYGKGLDALFSEVVYLPNSKTSFVPVDLASIEEAKARIEQESADMLAGGSEEDYPPSPNGSCRHCNFATLCKEGKKILSQPVIPSLTALPGNAEG